MLITLLFAALNVLVWGLAWFMCSGAGRGPRRYHRLDRD